MEQRKVKANVLSKLRMRKYRNLRRAAAKDIVQVLRSSHADSEFVEEETRTSNNQKQEPDGQYAEIESECFVDEEAMEISDVRHDASHAEGDSSDFLQNYSDASKHDGQNYDGRESADDGQDSDSAETECCGANANNRENKAAFINEPHEIEKLRIWAIEHKIQHTQLDALFVILKPRLLPQLPLSAKTFLKTTSSKHQIEKFTDSNGKDTAEFVYFGIATGLLRCINTKLHDINDTLALQINIDGLPLFKSSSKQFWPILCKVYFCPDIYKPFPVAVFAGNGKPGSVVQYLDKFIQEINELQANNIVINGKTFKVKIMCFVCDKPARSFIKCIKGHVGYYACERCTIQGKRVAKRMTYADTDCSERTNTSFRDKENPDHHIDTSPLLNIHPGIDMVNHFVLDFMHLCCLGIMKKLLIDCWLGAGNLSTKLCSQKRLEISQRMVVLKSQVPREFQRTTRSLEDIAKWKATEFSFFLNYCSPAVLKGILPKTLYKHLLLFHTASTACRILCSKNLSLKYNNEAKLYLRSFVSAARHYYGSQSQVLNMHNLIHLADDVRNMQCSLSEISAFPFENALGKMKKLLRSGHRPLDNSVEDSTNHFMIISLKSLYHQKSAY